MHADPKSITLTPAADFTLQDHLSCQAWLEVAAYKKHSNQVLIFRDSNSLRSYKDIFWF
jgi:hypothetical protein